MLIGRIHLSQNNQLSKVEVYKSSVLIDDFVVDSQHRIIGATHIFDSVIAITPEHDVVIIADSKEGVIGSTSVSIKPVWLTHTAFRGTLDRDWRYKKPGNTASCQCPHDQNINTQLFHMLWDNVFGVVI
ncbi:hypothetical protein [Photobacterium damselae]|uniref:hypothetical protein n=1 Tax=Photobacterium damselae TaxID=38293 RepID=UPI002F40B937